MFLKFNATNKDIFDCIKDGTKLVETRAATSKYKNVQAGEMVTFSCAGESFEKTIAKVTHFDSIDALLKTYKPENINPKLTTKEEIVKMYHSFPGYKEKIEQSGIIALELA